MGTQAAKDRFLTARLWRPLAAALAMPFLAARCPLGTVAALALLAALLALPPVAAAATKTWVDGSGNWDVAGNWSPSGQPVAGNDVLLTQTGAADRTVTYCNTTNPTALLKSLKIDATGAGKIALDLSSGDTLKVTTEYVGYDGKGAITQSAGDHTATTLYVGRNATGAGTYTMTGGTLTTSGATYIGYAGTGTVIVQSGGQICWRDATLGCATGSSGSLTVNGAASAVTASGMLTIGELGTGTLTLENSGRVTATEESVGAMGTVLQTGGINTVSSVSVAGGMYRLLGGTLQVTGGINVEGTLDFGTPGSSPTAFIIAPSGLVNLARPGTMLLGIGAASLEIGTGALLVLPAGVDPAAFGGISGSGLFHTAGTTLSIGSGQGFSGTGYVGDHVDCQGTITASTGGSITLSSGLAVSGAVDLGGGGLNINDNVSGVSGGTLKASYICMEGLPGSAITMTVQNGGQIIGAVGNIGGTSGGSATLIVDGVGSKWTHSSEPYSARELYIGSGGTGALIVRNGGEVSDTTGYIGYIGASATPCTATVDGNGSKWINSGELWVGYDSSGTLTVRDGGQVASADQAFVGGTNANGAVIVEGAGSVWNSTGTVYVGAWGIGASGNGFVTVKNGGHVATGSLGLETWDSVVTVNGGSLSAGTLWGVGTIRITDGAGGTALVLGSTESGEFDGTLRDDTGPGSVTKVGSGVQTFYGPFVVYTGTTRVQEGMLRLLNAPNFASAIENSATVDFVPNDEPLIVTSALRGGGTFIMEGCDTLTIAGPQDYDAGAVFEVLDGTVIFQTDAGAGGADLDLSVVGGEVRFACDQHLDTLEIGDGGTVVFAGAHVVVLNHLIMDGVDLGATTLTPEPATLALLTLGGLCVLARRRFSTPVQGSKPACR